MLTLSHSISLLRKLPLVFGFPLWMKEEGARSRACTHEWTRPNSRCCCCITLWHADLLFVVVQWLEHGCQCAKICDWCRAGSGAANTKATRMPGGVGRYEWNWVNIIMYKECSRIITFTREDVQDTFSDLTLEHVCRNVWLKPDVSACRFEKKKWVSSASHSVARKAHLRSLLSLCGFFEGSWLVMVVSQPASDVQRKARRANVQMIHIHYAYQTSLQSSPSHSQRSRKFGRLHATFQLNDCLSSSVCVTLWPWTKIKVIQTGITLQELSVFPIILRKKKSVD